MCLDLQSFGVRSNFADFSIFSKIPSQIVTFILLIRYRLCRLPVFSEPNLTRFYVTDFIYFSVSTGCRLSTINKELNMMMMMMMMMMWIVYCEAV